VLSRQLAGVGVTVQVPDGEPFDPDQHNPVGTEPTEEPGQHLLIASTVSPGYLDHGRLVRSPDVIVYRCGEAGDAR
jgi:molecular chaperone GrpE (heat shock protein)